MARLCAPHDLPFGATVIGKKTNGEYLNANINTVGHFGDVDLVFDVLEY